ncbi:murein L,D-transpeptidase catalytic domain family protein [Cellvibrio sp. pealriver]|uniref:murein L,D-transpeptidase catalytic domain family protein n=1 Tax=Cellvibrio sp. pealriver TaxID=1622269 RepID=UPI0009E403E9|nr:murein L,D-transpeptidase catalytic domain family protein [Cellvibrio sp. pealriver]
MLYTSFRALSFSALLSVVFVSFVSSAQASVAQTPAENPFSQVFNHEHTQALLNKLTRAAPAANPQVISLALSALDCALAQGMSPARNLTVIDYSLVSTKPRLWVFDLVSGKLLFQELVAHGMNTGKNVARHFSNDYGSHQTSLGLFRTKDTYVGANGYSLRMEGLEDGFNDRAMERAIVFHGADYVDLKLAQKLGHLGRSHGCPAVRRGIARKVIDTIKGEQFLFSYYPDKNWLSRSQFLNCPASQRWAKN